MRYRLLLVSASLAAILAVVLLASPQARESLGHSAGSVLMAEEAPLVPVDVVVLGVDAGSGGVLEAADIVRSGAARRVAIFAPPPGAVELELGRRGLQVEDLSARHARHLRALGVDETIELPPVTGTEEQGDVLPSWCESEGVRSLVFVTSWHHSRRVARVLERAFRESPIAVHVRISRLSDVDPDAWWRSREGARVWIIETQKLLWDVMRHPFQ